MRFFQSSPLYPPTFLTCSSHSLSAFWSSVSGVLGLLDLMTFLLSLMRCFISMYPTKHTTPVKISAVLSDNKPMMAISPRVIANGSYFLATLLFNCRRAAARRPAVTDNRLLFLNSLLRGNIRYLAILIFRGSFDCLILICSCLKIYIRCSKHLTRSGIHPVSVVFLYPEFMLWWLRLREC